MRTHVVDRNPGALIDTGHEQHPATRVVRWVVDHFALLPLGVATAMLWANTAPDAYFRFSHAWAFWVNEIGMAIFLALVAQDLYEAMLPGGELSHWHGWTASLLAAVGGIAGSVAAFLWFVDFQGEEVLRVAWPVVTGVDLAAGYYVMRLLYPRRHSAAALVLLAAAITDVMVMTVVTLQAPEFRIHIGGVILMLLALGGAAVLRRRAVGGFSPYWLACGALSWFALYWVGIHPALALLPLVPLMPHAVRRHDLFTDESDSDPIHRGEHEWNGAAQVALFMFGMVNGGVILKHVDTGTWAVILAAILGRPAGILIALGLALAAGLRLPRGMRWPDLVVAALATTSGFTFALFLAATVLPIGAVAEQITIGALATAAGALVTVLAARLLAVGRFKAKGQWPTS
jgi:NhaA family Na+:H+ antiporter